MIATAVICVIIAAIAVLGVFRYRKNLRSGCCGADSDPAPKKIRVQDRNVNHYPYAKILKIDGMTCQNCTTHVQNALNSLNGVFAKVSLGERNAMVYMKEEVPDQVLRKAIAEAGYTVMAISQGNRQVKGM
jgi:copper chaperone